MIRIGDFSKLSQVSIKTLRYYDEVGLLKPSSIDGETSYRYYAASQLPRLNRILALKDLGFSLQQIGQILNEGVSPEQLRGMLRLKRAELQQRLADEQERLARVEARLNTIAMEETMSNYDVILKQVDAQLVASVSDTLGSYPEVDRLFDEVYGYLSRFGAEGLGVAVWHDDEHKTSGISGEAAVYLKEPVPASERVKVYELPGATMASVVHHGAFNQFSQAYDAILRWIEANGYTIVGPNREVYLELSQPVRQDDDSYVTELQLPVAKKA